MSAVEMTATQVVEAAFGNLNVFLPGESIPPADMNFALGALNRMVSLWKLQPSMAMFTQRYRFDLVAGQGGPDDPYLIGDGAGEFDMPVPATQAMIVGANLILTTPDPEVRIPLTLLTTTAYDALAIPDLSGQPAAVYYNPSGRGSALPPGSRYSFYLWPVPSTATNDLELFVLHQASTFDDLTTVYEIQDGVAEALIYNLMLRLGAYGHPMSEDDKSIARLSLEVVQRGNVQLSDLPNDAMRAFGWRRRYNIEAGY